MTASDHLNQTQFNLHHGENQMTHQIWATNEHGEEVGHMHWSKQQRQPVHPDEVVEAAGGINNIEVDDDYQGRGIATAMYREGHKYSPQPLHSDGLEYPGWRWAQKVGGKTVWGTDVRNEPEPYTG